MKKYYRIFGFILVIALSGITIWKFDQFIAFFQAPEKLFLFMFFGFSIVVKQVIVHSYGHEMWRSIKGDDGKLQIHEIAGLAWLLNFEILMYAEVFFQREASDKVWYTMNIIFTSIIMGDFGSKFIKHKFSNESTPKSDKTGS